MRNGQDNSPRHHHNGIDSLPSDLPLTLSEPIDPEARIARTMRRYSAPWTVEALDGGFKIVDSNGQTLAYVYGHADPRDAESPSR